MRLLWLLDALNQGYKASVFELWSFGSRLATLWTVVALFFTRNLDLYRRQRPQMRAMPDSEADGQHNEQPHTPHRRAQRMTSFESLCNDDGGERDPVPLVEPSARLRLSPESVILAARKSPALAEQETGLLQDMRLNVLLAIDSAFAWVRHRSERVLASSYGSIAFTLVVTLPMVVALLLVRLGYRALRFLWRGRVDSVVGMMVDESTLDQRSIHQVVAQAGYPFVRYQVITDDGYIIRLDRLPNPGSTRVAYLQHGVFDNSFCWVSTGTRSLAFRLHDLGYDVYLGNLRGTTSSELGQRHVDENISSPMNEHAMYDLPAFFRMIATVKRGESERCSYKLTIVSHSLGAAVTLMYLVLRRLGLVSTQPLPVTKCAVEAARLAGDHLTNNDTIKNNQSFSYLALDVDDENFNAAAVADDALCGAVCLSPAGIHHRAPRILYILIPLIEMLLFFVPIHVFRFPSRKMGSLVAKLWQDVKQAPSSKLLMGFLVSMLVGGEADNHPVHLVKPQHIFAGTSTMTYRHFVQLWRSDRFQGFDFGPAKNKAVYGSPHPVGIAENYALIDVPVHFVMGSKDHLIPCENIVMHYNALHAAHPQLAYLDEFKHSGHLEFTVGLHDTHISRIVQIVDGMQASSMKSE